MRHRTRPPATPIVYRLSLYLIMLFIPYGKGAPPRRRGRTIDGVVRSLGRITKHLPYTTLDDPLNRITIDARGRIWVIEDTTLVLLKGHLLIEAELIDICGRLLKNPDALEAGRVSFSVRLESCPCTRR